MTNETKSQEENMKKTNDQLFEEWVTSEDRSGGVFENNNNFTRDHWMAEKAFLACAEIKDREIAELEKQLAEEEANCDCLITAQKKRKAELKEAVDLLREAMELLNECDDSSKDIKRFKQANQAALSKILGGEK